MTHFRDQGLDRKGKTQTTAAVGFVRAAVPAGQCFYQTLQVLLDLAEAHIGGDDLEGVFRLVRVNQRQRITCSGVFSTVSSKGRYSRPSLYSLRKRTVAWSSACAQ